MVLLLKGYESWHENEKSEKGHKDKEDHEHHYDENEGEIKKHEDEGRYQKEHIFAEKGEKNAKFDEKGEHQSGHSTKGKHLIHKKVIAIFVHSFSSVNTSSRTSNVKVLTGSCN